MEIFFLHIVFGALCDTFDDGLFKSSILMDLFNVQIMCCMLLMITHFIEASRNLQSLTIDAPRNLTILGAVH